MTRVNITKLLDAFAAARPRLESIARARTGSGGVAEDVLQDTWLRLAGIDVAGTIDNPIGFATRAVGNAVTDHLRKESRRGRIDAELADLMSGSVEELSPERIAIAREQLRAVWQALDAMPARSRDIFMSNRFSGKSHRAIATELGITEEAVYYHIRRVLERLAAVRDGYGD
jgi:RNA polymerase sigma factor (sigma-70 family)